MPRRKKAPLGDAVVRSPLFQLSPEIRNFIYRLILSDSSSHYPLFIPRDHFARRKKEPAYRCDTCHEVFKNAQRLETHLGRYRNGEPCRPPSYKIPAISTNLLRTCRLIHTEAAPLLYRANAFYFTDPRTLHNFRWRTASKLSAWVEELVIEQSARWIGELQTKEWGPYLCGNDPQIKKGRLREDFPHLKRLMIVLKDLCLLYSESQMQNFCDLLVQNLDGLTWVHVVGLNDEDFISKLKPLVEADDNMTHPLQAQMRKEQSRRLLGMACDQANHQPEDVALQAELGDARMEIVQNIINTDSAIRQQLLHQFPNHALQNHQMQLILLAQRRIQLLSIVKAGLQGSRSLPSTSSSTLRLILAGVQCNVRLLEVKARHAHLPCDDLAKAINDAEAQAREIRDVLEKRTASGNQQA
ncbi:MAG: hypothetical protein Q9222_000832 [Ikaeria aurantiellina]